MMNGGRRARPPPPPPPPPPRALAAEPVSAPSCPAEIIQSGQLVAASAEWPALPDRREVQLVAAAGSARLRACCRCPAAPLPPAAGEWACRGKRRGRPCPAGAATRRGKGSERAALARLLPSRSLAWPPFIVLPARPRRLTSECAGYRTRPAHPDRSAPAAPPPPLSLFANVRSHVELCLGA
ncbi:hypothetical protein SETIT_2G359900v2 [Setaria italica]|uniref:Uncharacterized protein n=1 Tax=Setaria italica TaxID=4555 RepID=A0A368Q728_SETIT|nr:hypothetical protein SETIT_2G359900v2 [Setaria italica]